MHCTVLLCCACFEGRSDNAVKNRWNANKKFRGTGGQGQGTEERLIPLLSDEELLALGVRWGPNGGIFRREAAPTCTPVVSTNVQDLDNRVSESEQEFTRLSISVPIPDKPPKSEIAVAIGRVCSEAAPVVETVVASTQPLSNSDTNGPKQVNSLQSSPLGNSFLGGDFQLGGDPLDHFGYDDDRVNASTSPSSSLQSSFTDSVLASNEGPPRLSVAVGEVMTMDCSLESPERQHVTKYHRTNHHERHRRVESDPGGATGNSLAHLHLRRASDPEPSMDCDGVEIDGEHGIEACLDDQHFSFAEFGALESVVDNSQWENAEGMDTDMEPDCTARCADNFSSLFDGMPDFFQLCSGSASATDEYAGYRRQDEDGGDGAVDGVYRGEEHDLYDL